MDILTKSSDVKVEATGQSSPIQAPVASITNTDSIIERADAIATRIENSNKKAEELLARHEAVAARILLGGRAEAGAPVKTPEQSLKEKQEAEVKAALTRFR